MTEGSHAACRWVKALYRKAAALQQLGQPAGAAAVAQQAALLEPGNREVQALLQQLGPAASVAAQQTWQQAAGPTKPAPSAALLPPLLAAAPWEYAPAPDGVEENLLLLLHGLGDRPAAFAKLAQQMALPQVHQWPADTRCAIQPTVCVSAVSSNHHIPGDRAHPPPLPPACRVPRWRWAALRRCRLAMAAGRGTLCSQKSLSS